MDDDKIASRFEQQWVKLAVNVPVVTQALTSAASPQHLIDVPSVVADLVRPHACDKQTASAIPSLFAEIDNKGNKCSDHATCQEFD